MHVAPLGSLKAFAKELHKHGVVHIAAERAPDRLKVSAVPVAGDGGIAVATADEQRRHKLGVCIRREPKPCIASPSGSFEHGLCVLGFRADKSPYLVNL
jgi:hypothetical protein